MIVRLIFIAFLFCFSIIFLFDLSYLFHGVRCTYLRGESSAQIDDYQFFHNRVINSANPFIIPNSKTYNMLNSVELDSVLKNSKTTAFLVVKNDSVYFEKYFLGYNKNTPSNSFSMAKSIVSLLIGFAIQDGFIVDFNQSVFDFIPELQPFKKTDVSIKNLLEMSSGLSWLENYKRPINITAKAYYGNNLEKLLLKSRFIENPGEIFRYQSGNTQLLGIIINRAVGENISSYASRVLWSKIGSENNAFWTLDDYDGLEKTFCCFNSTARDFSRIGSLVLNNGVLFEERIISKEYLDWMTSISGLIEGDKTFRTDTLVDYYSKGWWNANVLNKKIVYARGFNGQYIVTIPELNIVFVRLGLFENEDSEKNNPYVLTDNLLFLIKYIINNYSN